LERERLGALEYRKLHAMNQSESTWAASCSLTIT